MFDAVTETVLNPFCLFGLFFIVHIHSEWKQVDLLRIVCKQRIHNILIRVKQFALFPRSLLRRSAGRRRTARTVDDPHR